MKASKLSLLLTVSLICGTGKLDLSCPAFSASPRVKTPLVGFAPLDERQASQAYVVRWGGGKKKDAEPRWIVSVGNIFQQALFWAAVASVLL